MASVLERRMIEPRSHLTALDVAAYLDDATSAGDASRIQTHLLECAECRDEIAETARLARAVLTPVRSRMRLWVPLVAAAGIVLVLGPPLTTPDQGEHRDAPVTTTVSPRAVAPSGRTETPRTFVWTSVPAAYRYHVRVFTADGAVLWERATTDTTLVMPASIPLGSRQSYFWKVEAFSGFERRASSETIEFITPGGR